MTFQYFSTLFYIGLNMFLVP